MSDCQKGDNQQGLRRSVNSKQQTHVTFVCRTRRKVDIFWLDYNGQKIKYATLRAGMETTFVTYLTHPWVFRDADTFDVLVANNRDEYFYPVLCEREDPQIVTVDAPAWSLKEICIQKVRQLMSDDDIAHEHLPKDLIGDLLTREDRAHGFVFFYDPLIE